MVRCGGRPTRKRELVNGLLVGFYIAGMMLMSFLLGTFEGPNRMTTWQFIGCILFWPFVLILFFFLFIGSLGHV